MNLRVRKVTWESAMLEASCVDLGAVSSATTIASGDEFVGGRT
jgi:hypothetical protein